MPRYIDADALMEDLRIVKPITETEAVAFRFAYCKVKDAPTADVQEVRHGKWLEVKECPSFYTCSKCGGFGSKALNYCPMCGARMDAETQKGENK